MSERQHLPDELRGFALLGIVVVNVPFLGISLGGFGSVGGGGPADRAVEFAVTAFAQGKFYLLFAFLFGYSAALMMRRPGRTSSVRFARRLVGLAVIGIAHALLFFVGDILLTYAVIGVALLVLHPRSDRLLVRVAVVSAVVTVCWLAMVVAATYAYPSGDDDFGASTYDAVMATGTFGEAVAARWQVYPAALILLATLNSGLVLSMFCLGMVAGRRNLLAAPDAGGPLWRRCRRWGLLVGLPGGVAAAVLTIGPDGVAATAFQSSGQYIVGIAIGFVTAPALAAGYVGLIVALRERRQGLLRIFRPAGRMSLTLYLGESVLLAAVFGGWGLGLFGELPAVAVVAIGMGAWLVLDLLANWWMHRFRYGPIEALLRWFTTGERPVTRSLSIP